MSTDSSTYRVYTQGELQSIAPTTYRSSPPPPSRGGFAVGFVLAVCIVIGGGSLAALRYLNVDLANGRTSLGGSSAAAIATPPTPSTAAPAAPPRLVTPVPVVVVKTPATPASSASAAAAGNASKITVRRKVRGIRHNAGGAVDATGPDPLPPNPFDGDDRGSLSALKATTQGVAP